MKNSAVEITNLLYRYAELIDGGDFEGCAALFADAAIILDRSPDAPPVDAPTMLALWRSSVIVYDDGTVGCPAAGLSGRTRHLVTNPILTIDEEGGTATCRSTYTVLQQVPGSELRPVASGRYLDRFVRVDGTWRFSERDFTMLDLVDDLSRHLTIDPP